VNNTIVKAKQKPRCRWSALILIVICQFSITSCGVVSSGDWQKAEIACEHFDGIKKVFLRGTSVICNNEMEITL